MRLSTVALGVRDLAAAEHFYVQGLGWTVDSRPQPDLVYLATGTTRVALYPLDALARYAGATLQPGAGSLLGLNVDSREDVETLCARAAAHGGRVVRAPQRLEWGGFAGVVADRDGHLLEIVWSPQSVAKS